MNTDTQLPSALSVTSDAAVKVRSLLQEQGKTGHVLRVFIQGGGCSGFQYGFNFEAEAASDDMLVEQAGVKVAVDPMSFQYLAGAVLDYKEDLEGARFVVKNPNATTTCGCGSSFGI